MVKVSVVMSVYNGAARLRETIDSLLAQTEQDFELIVVDDGSTDETPSILASYPRLRVIAQENRGLTRALIRGCEAATAPLIARHDAGDVSHPERLQRQLAAMQEGVVLVSCAVQLVGPRDEPLYVTAADGDEVRRSLLHDGIDAIRGLPHHGSAMFRRDAYARAGGYRAPFWFAQDLDLWLRMAPLGRIIVLPEPLYTASLDLNAISARHRREQVLSASYALQLRDTPNDALLGAVATIRPGTKKRSRLDDARALYFIAATLRRNRDPRWRGYARRALVALLRGGR